MTPKQFVSRNDHKSIEPNSPAFLGTNKYFENELSF